MPAQYLALMLAWLFAQGILTFRRFGAYEAVEKAILFGMYVFAFCLNLICLVNTLGN